MTYVGPGRWGGEGGLFHVSLMLGQVDRRGEGGLFHV